ncbi:MAG: hypothetical protein U1E27_10540 [Kiritimatiellia bacterium]|nr:hypothetical protein [Kiritimatiellia bacterium]
MKTGFWRTAVLLTGSIFVLAASAADPIREWGVGAQAYTIGLGDMDVYGWGIGAEVQNRFWATDAMGWAFSLGLAQWETSSQSSNWGAPVSGSLRLFPLGASLLLRTPGTASTRYVAEAGLRYVIADSDVRLQTAGGRQNVSIDNGVVGALGLDWEKTMGNSVFFVGASYQFDLVAAEAKWSDGLKSNRLRDNDLEALVFRTGFRRSF